MSTTPTKFNFYNVIVCGSRDFNNKEFIYDRLDKILVNLPKEITSLVSGCAKGPDSIAIKYGEDYNYKVWRFPPDWQHFAKSAGIVRNTLMADFSTHCIAFWDGKSTGTADMIQKAQKYNLTLRVIKV